MQRVLGRYAKYFYALLRIVSGLMFAMHGSQKLFGFPGNRPTVPISSQLGIAGVIELVCGILIAVGLLTSYAALVASGEMAAAFFIRHFPQGFYPILNQGELAVLYCFVFLYIAAQGSGIWSLGSRVGRRGIVGSATG